MTSGNYKMILDNDLSEADIEVVYNAMITFNQEFAGPNTLLSSETF